MSATEYWVWVPLLVWVGASDGVVGCHFVLLTPGELVLLVVGLVGSGCVFSHVDLAGVDGDGAVDDTVADRVGVDTGSEAVVPVEPK